MAEYHSISDLVKLSINNKQELWQVVLTGQAHDKLMSERDVFAQMKKMYQAMKSADEQYDQQLRSPSKMAGGDGYKMRIYNESGRNICGDFIGVVMEKALKMGESNACMKRIVAAPTAGSCGVIPAVLLSYEKCFGVCGLVEVPCIKRNVSGAVNAITAAQMTMAGIKSVIPADEVIDSMRRIGNDMPVCLKETGEGGLAITPTAKVYKQKLNNIDN